MTMKNIFLSVLLAVAFFAPSLPAAAQTADQFRERGEWMLDMMMGSRRPDFEKDLGSRYGDEFVGRMYESMGKAGGSWGTRGLLIPGGMMGMMSMMGAGYGLGNAAGIFGWLWAVVWTVNSVLLGVLLWVLIKRFLK